ncbi:hypothetical protein HOF65_01860, partial [bacterium]|nr:hypothetical protein [bacterium]
KAHIFEFLPFFSNSSFILFIQYVTFSKLLPSLKVLLKLWTSSSQSKEVDIHILCSMIYANFSSSINVRFVTSAN